MWVAVVTFAVLVVAFSAFAHRLGRWNVTAPIVFVVAGSVIGLTVQAPPASQVIWVKYVAEMTLALVLFHDAAQVDPRDIASDRGLVARMLAIAFPLTVLAGLLLARVVLPDLPGMLCLLLAATLAPTDAGLGAATVLNRVVPVRIRRLLNVESGLNDGLATPVALFAIAALAGTDPQGPLPSLTRAAASLALGVGVGVCVGVGAAGLLGWSRRHGWSTTETRALAVLALPVVAFGGAELAHGNGFVAAYVAGTALTGAGPWLASEHSALHLTEVVTAPLGFAVWAVFGLVAIPAAWDALTPAGAAYALMSLTVLRMAPIALALLGTGLRGPTVLFVGWFGPRGLVSVVFALIAVESLDMTPELRGVLSIVGISVAASVLAHGLSATPLAQRYGAWVDRTEAGAETSPRRTADPFEARPRGSILRDS